jgi:uncharacterized protein YjbI with pentapeptide repeats
LSATADYRPQNKQSHEVGHNHYALCIVHYAFEGRLADRKRVTMNVPVAKVTLEKNYSGAEFERTSFDNVKIQECSMVNAKLDRVNLNSTTFSNCDFTNVTIENSKIENLWINGKKIEI